MKKLLTTVLVAILAIAMTACSTPASQIGTPPTTTTTTTTPSDLVDILPEGLEFTEESLITAYCAGDWNGSFINDESHCASIVNGELWLDCGPAYRFPDMGTDKGISNQVITTTPDGTWTFDHESGAIELWSRGFRKEKFVLFLGESLRNYVDFFVLSDCLVARYGAELQVFDLQGREDLFLDNVVDVVQDETGILVSTFEHKNFRIRGYKDVEELDSSYVRFQSTMGSIVPSDDTILNQVSNLYRNTDWDGKCRQLDGKFVAVDYYGNIVVNNEVVGHISLGNNVVETEGRNLWTGFGLAPSYWLTGSQLHVFERGELRVVDVPDGDGQILWVEDGNVVAIAGDTLFVVYNDGTVNTIASGVVDANVASDTLYYMVEDVVYSLAWQYPSANPSMFFEGAYAVSPHSDECQGALVPQEYANSFTAYGYSNIYMP